MASRIRGITIEIGGDTTKLEQSLKSVNSTIKSTQSQLKDVTKLLKLDPKNTELLSQKQRLLKDAVQATKEKPEALKEAQIQAKQQLENGDLGQDKYDALQREIVETEEELRRLGQESKKVTYDADPTILEPLMNGRSSLRCFPTTRSCSCGGST